MCMSVVLSGGVQSLQRHGAVLSREGKLRKPHTFPFLSCFQTCRHLLFSFTAYVRGTLQDCTDVSKLKE